MKKCEALAFVVDHSAKNYLPDLTLEETARFVATGAGVFGSTLAYVESLADHFQMPGIEDDALDVLRHRARQIAAG
jgi:cation transport protein ChaC